MFIVTWGKLGWIYHFIDYFCTLLTLGSGLNVSVLQQNTGHSLISKWLVNYSQRTSQAVTPNSSDLQLFACGPPAAMLILKISFVF